MIKHIKNRILLKFSHFAQDINQVTRALQALTAIAINIPLQESVLFSIYSDIILSSVSYQRISITSNILTLGVDLEPKTILRLKIYQALPRTLLLSLVVGIEHLKLVVETLQNCHRIEVSPIGDLS